MLGDIAEHRGADGIAVLERLPRQPLLRVFVIEQINEPFGRGLGRTERTSYRSRRREVVADELDQSIERLRRRSRAPATRRIEEQVERQDSPVARGHRLHLVAAIGVEGDEYESARRAAIADLL